MSAGGARPGSAGRVLGLPGAVVFLTVYVLLLYLIPSRLVVGPLGSVGSPAVLWGLAGAVWWGASAVARLRPQRLRPSTVRQVVLLFAGAALASSVVAMSRPISDTEASTNEAGLIVLASWIGVFLMAHDGLSDSGQLDTVIRRLTLVGGVVALLGILQFATGRPLVDYIEIPGLTTNVDLVSVRDRSGFARPSGTAIHPIEFGTTMVMLFPLAVHMALHARAGGGLVARWWPVAVIGMAIPLSVSRSALVALVLSIAIMAPTWSPRGRLVAAGVAAAGTAVLFVAVPGFIGSVAKLFTTAGTDSSVLSRSDSYDLALDFVARAPLLGRGYLTFLPRYRILDNQYLGTLIDVGIIGFLALVAVFVAGIVVSAGLWKNGATPSERSLGVSFVAATTAAAASFAFFDAFSFPQMAGTTFLILGLIGGAVRLRTRAPRPGVIPGTRTAPEPVRASRDRRVPEDPTPTAATD